MDHRDPGRITPESDPHGASGRTTSEDDAILIDGLRRDDEEAMSLLYDRYGASAYGLACRMLGETAEAEDVVQEAFLALWRQAGSFDPGRGALRSYLLTIVHRRAIDTARRRSSRPQQPLDVTQPLASGDSDPFDMASAEEQRALVQAALGDLPADQRRAVELTYFGGLTIAEMAATEGIPLGTAKSRLRLALERMRKALTTQAGAL